MGTGRPGGGFSCSVSPATAVAAFGAPVSASEIASARAGPGWGIPTPPASSTCGSLIGGRVAAAGFGAGAWARGAPDVTFATAPFGAAFGFAWALFTAAAGATLALDLAGAFAWTFVVLAVAAGRLAFDRSAFRSAFARLSVGRAARLGAAFGAGFFRFAAMTA